MSCHRSLIYTGNWGKRAISANQITYPNPSYQVENNPYDLRLLQLLSRSSKPNDIVIAAFNNNDRNNNQALNDNYVEEKLMSDIDDNLNRIKLVN
ncbi:unnamed protein product [Didymodactylos carnosus]|uniref:Uncharacterized protein n=1 Tax=Didymodactylos carnosus TaxID=1234261 RepID=A0A814W2F6_9BILA|nr:unnamed protein product [Didymodactylos carnosus]CAF1195629.1 unnamed protein product [Didymodactylos carnosus]CAF3780075.1 unnamed protein product [Didymodactylos carnosus]CAF3960048.1 unnamed protein product [Didymodactylos carnosus]